MRQLNGPYAATKLHKDDLDQMARAAEVPKTSPQTAETPADMRFKVSGALAKDVATWLDDAKAENIVTIDIKDKSSIGDFMIVATGRTDRHVGAIADQVRDKLREAGMDRVRMEGQPQCDWVLVDAGEVIIHVLRPEVREFYNLEKMWMADRPAEVATH